MVLVDSGEDKVNINTTVQTEDEDVLAGIHSPELPNVLELQNNDGSSRTDGEKLPQLKNLQGWQERIRKQCNGNDYRLAVCTTDDTTLAFIDMLTELTKGCIVPKEYKPPALTTCDIEQRCALVSPMRPFEM